MRSPKSSPHRLDEGIIGEENHSTLRVEIKIISITPSRFTLLLMMRNVERRTILLRSVVKKYHRGNRYIGDRPDTLFGGTVKLWKSLYNSWGGRHGRSTERVCISHEDIDTINDRLISIWFNVCRGAQNKPGGSRHGDCFAR